MYRFLEGTADQYMTRPVTTVFLSGERSVQVANRSAKAAETSADVAQDALISVQRAFVSFDGFEVQPFGAEVQLLPKWQNGGATAANPVTNYISWKLFDGAPPTDYSFPDLDSRGNELPSKGVGTPFHIGPKAIKYGEIVRVPITLLEQVRAGQRRFFIWGWVEYRDVLSTLGCILRVSATKL
jgi:hypothetical protein